jgi:hypothetical protein
MIPEPITVEERAREAELEALCRKITEEGPRFFDRLANRALAEAKAEGGGDSMEEFLGLPRRQRSLKAPHPAGEPNTRLREMAF